MAYSIEDQVVALAGVFQAAALVNQIAKQGNVSESAFESSIGSLLVTNPENTETVFGGHFGVSMGLKEMIIALDRGQQNQQAEIIRYSLSLLHLESKLQKKPDMLNVIGKRIDQAVDQARHFHPTHTNVIKNLAGVYLDTISTFNLRIQVHGDPNNLKAPDNAERIRATLLAGIRAAILWRQTGGRRWHLIFKRRQMLDTARYILQANA